MQERDEKKYPPLQPNKRDDDYHRKFVLLIFGVLGIFIILVLAVVFGLPPEDTSSDAFIYEDEILTESDIIFGTLCPLFFWTLLAIIITGAIQSSD